jgi:general secretion pathway protein N
VHVRLSDQPAAQPSRWPSALLAGLGTPWNTLQLQGSLALTSQQLELQWQSSGWRLAGRAQLDAQQMSSSLSTLKPMGSYRLVLQGGPEPTLQLTTLEGSLQLSGSGRWLQGGLRFEGEASAAHERAEALANLLNIIGRRDGTRSIIKVG